jgi:hypothetical protein
MKQVSNRRGFANIDEIEDDLIDGGSAIFSCERALVSRSHDVLEGGNRSWVFRPHRCAIACDPEQARCRTGGWTIRDDYGVQRLFDHERFAG